MLEELGGAAMAAGPRGPGGEASSARAGRRPAPELGARGWQLRAVAAVWAIRFQMVSARKWFFSF